MSPVLVLLLLSPLLLSLLIVGGAVWIAVIRVSPTEVQGVLSLLVRLLACLGRHFPKIGAGDSERPGAGATDEAGVGVAHEEPGVEPDMREAAAVGAQEDLGSGGHIGEESEA